MLTSLCTVYSVCVIKQRLNWKEAGEDRESINKQLNPLSFHFDEEGNLHPPTLGHTRHIFNIIHKHNSISI